VNYELVVLQTSKLVELQFIHPAFITRQDLEPSSLPFHQSFPDFMRNEEEQEDAGESRNLQQQEARSGTDIWLVSFLADATKRR
jgi:hypothetical protein